MSDVKLQAARELIQERQYAAARAVLETMPSHPTAQKWLSKLDQIAPIKPNQVRPLPKAVRQESAPAVKVQTKKSSTGRTLLILVIILGALIGGVWLWQHDQQLQRWNGQKSKANAALTVFCQLRLSRMNAVSCDQWVTKLLNEDISRTDTILFCDGLYNPSGKAFSDDNYAELLINCLANKGIYLP